MFIDAGEHFMNCKWQRGGSECRGFPIETLSSHDNCKYCSRAITELCSISSCYSEMFLNIFVLFICMIRGTGYVQQMSLSCELVAISSHDTRMRLFIYLVSRMPKHDK